MIEEIILNNLATRDEYARVASPHLQKEYFTTDTTKVLFSVISDFFDKYNALPSKEALLIDLEKVSGLSQSTYDEATGFIEKLEKDMSTELEWLVNETETHCQDRAIYNSITSSINILHGEDKSRDKGAIPKLLEDALSVSFTTTVGHDYLADAEERYDFYNSTEEKVPFHLTFLNKATNGGVERKSLNVILGGTGTGKSLIMCDWATNNLLEGLNVLYITCEMQEKKIGQRIDANLMDIEVNDIERLTKEDYLNKIKSVKKRAKGKLVIKEYPTSSASVIQFKTVLKELKQKKNFVPDIIYIDYLNICLSSRIKMQHGFNSYTIVKSIAEELRALAIEYNVPVISATQTNKEGNKASDLDVTNVSESIGLPQTCDLLLGVVRNDELDMENKIMFIQIKNRYNDASTFKRFYIGINRPKMQLYNIEQSDYIAGQHGDITQDKTPPKMSSKFDDWA